MQDHEHLEDLIVEWAKIPYVVACSSGTAALHLALEVLRLPPGSEVLCADYNMIAVPRAVTLAGLTPVFVDCKPDLLMDMDLLEHACSRKDAFPRVVICSHLYGRVVDMDSVVDIANKYGLYIIEDLAEAHGVKPDYRADMAVWSFYKNKIVAGEEGGAVGMRFKGSGMPLLARQLRCLGFTDSHDFRHVPRGFNGRLAPSLARLIIPNLMNVVNILAERRAIEAIYDSLCPAEWKMPPRVVPWVYDLRVRGMGKKDQDTLVQALNLYGIQARHGFKRMTTQAEYRYPHKYQSSKSLDPDVVGLDTEVFYFPIQPGVTTEEGIRRGFEIAKRVLGM